MSRLDDEIKNPAKAFLQWDATKGELNYWDKNKGEKGEKVYIPLPFTFMALDTLATIKGYSDAHKSGFWSNEVKNIRTDTLTVRTKGGVAATGLYADIIGSKACVGAKFCQSVYIVANINGESAIANIQMKGTALSAWIDFTKENKIYKGAITISGTKQGKKGATVFQTPVFESVEVSPETEEKAKEMAKTLKAYLDVYLVNKPKETEVITENPE